MRYLVIDAGSSSGKVYLAEFNREKGMLMEEAGRFPMERSFFCGHECIDIYSIYDRICSIIKDLSRRGVRIDAMGIDSWCCDYGIIDVDSGAVTMPVFYRDTRTDGYPERVKKIMPYEEIYKLTTQREIANSTLCQLMAYKQEYPKGLSGNKKILFIGDLLMYFFTGRICSEISVASYSQMFSIEKGWWEPEIFKRFHIPEGMIPPVVGAGTILGKIKGPLARHLGAGEVSVTAPAIHDTASAAVVVPACPGENFAFLATGSWFLMSMETDHVADKEQSYQYQLSNTGMAFGKILLKKNITAMWLLQECKRQWQRMGIDLTYDEISLRAGMAKRFSCFLDTEYEGFYHPENMAAEICAYLKMTGQSVPDEKDAGQIARILYESIALQCARALDMLKSASGRQVDTVYVIGGANRSSVLNQLLSDAFGLAVKTGPSEASSMGNAFLQAYGMGEVESLEEIRTIVRQSVKTDEYKPQDTKGWAVRRREYETFLEIEGGRKNGR